MTATATRSPRRRREDLSQHRLHHHDYDADDELTSVTYSDGVTPDVTSIGHDADGQRTP